MADFSIVFGQANLLFEIFYALLLLNTLNAVMLKQECPVDETHRSCSFYKEYTCWEDEGKLERVMILPRRLSHCTTGCYCKTGYVRGYPNGPCIQAPYCMDVRIRDFLSKLPA